MTERPGPGRMVPKGFSLVEVVLAIGIVSFAVLAILALLPVGLKSANDAPEEAFAAQTLKSLSASLQGASHTNTNAPLCYTALPPFNNAGALLQWSVGDPAQAGQTIYIGYDGLPTASRSSARLIACVRISPPANLLSLGSAYLCLAWPANAIGTPIVWSNGQPQITNQQGYMEAIIIFVPTSP